MCARRPRAEWMDSFHACDIRRQTADWADQKWGTRWRITAGYCSCGEAADLFSHTNLISADANPQCVLFIIGQLLQPYFFVFEVILVIGNRVLAININDTTTKFLLN